jgi:hypothetical protein
MLASLRLDRRINRIPVFKRVTGMPDGRLSSLVVTGGSVVRLLRCDPSALGSRSRLDPLRTVLSYKRIVSWMTARRNPVTSISFVILESSVSVVPV